MPETVRKTRRQIMAEIVILGNPARMHEHEPIGQGKLSVEFDSIAELDSWLNLAGHAGEHVLTGDRSDTTKAGKTRRRKTAYPEFNGWEIFASAVDVDGGPGVLEGTTLDALAVVAAALEA